MLLDGLWTAVSIGSLTQLPNFPEITANNRGKKTKKITLLHLSLPNYPERYGPTEEREDIISSIFRAPMETHLE